MDTYGHLPLGTWANANLTWSKTVRWTETGYSTSFYHTISSKISTMRIYYTTDYLFSKYTSNAGSWNNVYLMPVAPNTLYMSSEVSNDSNGYSYDYRCPVTREISPRYLSADELTDYPSYAVIGFYSDGSMDVLDFYSQYNALVYQGWSVVTTTPTLASKGLRPIK